MEEKPTVTRPAPAGKNFQKCFNVELFRSWIAFAVLDEHLVRRGRGGAADGSPGDYVSRPEGKNDGLSSAKRINLVKKGLIEVS